MQSSKGDGALLGGTYLIMKTIKNVGASVRQRLANLSKAEEKPFHEILQYYAMERFLHRLALSPHCKTFILKGGLMLWVWGGLSARHTMDIDMLGQTSNDVSSVVQIMKDFYDIWLLSKKSDFKSDELLEAIKRTFNNRGTDFGEQLPFLEPTFAKNRASNWKTFRRKMKSDSIPESFTQILTDLKPFLEPLSKALRTGNALGNWRAGQGWTKGIF